MNRKRTKMKRKKEEEPLISRDKQTFRMQLGSEGKKNILEKKRWWELGMENPVEVK